MFKCLINSPLVFFYLMSSSSARYICLNERGKGFNRLLLILFDSARFTQIKRGFITCKVRVASGYLLKLNCDLRNAICELRVTSCSFNKQHCRLQLTSWNLINKIQELQIKNASWKLKCELKIKVQEESGLRK